MATIEKTLLSIESSVYRNFEVIISDGFSEDGTELIVNKFGYNFCKVGGGLLEARIDGINLAKGEVIVLLDADQQLKPDSLSRIAKGIDLFDMVVLEEVLAKNRLNILDRMWEYEKRGNRSLFDLSIDPMNGSVLPRVFKSSLLKQAILEIPDYIVPWLRHPDHQIIYFECYKISKSIGVLNDAIYYIERTNPIDLIKTYFRHGRDAKRLRHTKYECLVKAKFKTKPSIYLRSGSFMGSHILQIIKSMSFILGYLL